MQISTSYSRKLNHAQYGGMEYENSDHFCSISEEVLIDPSLTVEERDDGLKEIATKLQAMCRSLVETSVSNEVTGLSGGMPRLQFNKVLDLYITKGTMTSEEYETMSPMQKDIIQAVKRSKQRNK